MTPDERPRLPAFPCRAQPARRTSSRIVAGLHVHERVRHVGPLEPQEERAAAPSDAELTAQPHGA